MYRLRFKDPNGGRMGDEEIRALTDAEAIDIAQRRLRDAAIIEVWRRARWVAQVQRPVGLMLSHAPA